MVPMAKLNTCFQELSLRLHILGCSVIIFTSVEISVACN